VSYPTVRAVVRRVRAAPATPTTEHRLTIQLRGDTFAVIDADGRSYAELIAEATSERGLGRLPRTIEDLMDATSAAHRPPPAAPSEFSGDLASGRGIVIEAGREPREVPAQLLAPIAEQVLAGDLVGGRTPTGTVEHLGRPCAEYRFTLTGHDDGRPFRSDIRLLVADGLVLLREVHDADLDGLWAVAEVIELG
jgi:hypothetical protein